EEPSDTAEAEPVETSAPEKDAEPAAPAPPARQPAASAPATPPPPPAAPTRAPFIPPRIPRTPPPARSGQGGGGRGGQGPRPVFSSSAPGGGPARPGSDRPAPARTFGPDAEKAGSRKKSKKGRRGFVDQEAVQANIAKTLQGMRGPGGRKGRRSDEPSYRDMVAGRMAEEKEKEKTRIRVNEFISVSELAAAMKIPATQIVQFAFKELGLMVTVNQRLDFDQIDLIASEFGFEAVREDEYKAEA